MDINLRGESEMNFRLARYIVSGIALACISAGAGAAEGKEGMLAGTHWQLVQLGPNGALEGAQPTLTFAPGGKISGSGACNTFEGAVTISGTAITIGPLKTTKKSCSDAINKQEATYFKALGQASQYEIGINKLSITTKLWNEPLQFVTVNP